MVAILFGPPKARRDPFAPEQLTVGSGEYIGTSFEQTFSLNPSEVLGRVNKLKSLEPGEPPSYIDETGQRVVTGTRLADSDPRARRMSVEEANEKGKDVGLRFSEPPTIAQFDYLAEQKRRENERLDTLSKAPSFGTAALGFVADLAATAVDPANITASIIPVVGPSRYAAWVSQFGKTGARALRGAAEGAVGSALVVPGIYAGAQLTQQQYDEVAAFYDVLLGTALGSGLHVAGGKLGDVISHYSDRVYREGLMRAAGEESEYLPNVWLVEDPWETRRGGRSLPTEPTASELRSIVASLDRETQQNVLRGAVRTLENDKAPKVDVLLDTDPALRSLSIPDKRFPSVLRLRSELTQADFAEGTTAAQIQEEYLRSLNRRTAEGQPASTYTDAIYKHYAKHYSKLRDYSVSIVEPDEFQVRAGDNLEHPEQRVYIEHGSKTILAQPDVSRGAFRHAVEEALDEAYAVPADERGGYRYRRKDDEGAAAHRASIRALYEELPDRRPAPKRGAQEAVDLFSRDHDPILNSRGQEASDRAWDSVNNDKDKDLDTILADEEVAVVEDVARVNTGLVKELGIAEKVIPLEERELLDAAATPKAAESAQKTLFEAAEEAAVSGKRSADLDAAEVLMRIGPERWTRVARGELTLDAAIREAGAEITPRQDAAASVHAYIRTVEQGEDLQGAALQRAIDNVQSGLSVEEAVRGARAGEELMARADQALEEAEARFEVEGEGDEILDNIEEIANTILRDPDAMRNLHEVEAQSVRAEHDTIDEIDDAGDLFSQVERDTADVLDRNRALREGAGVTERRERALTPEPGEGETLEAGLQTVRSRRTGETAGRAGAAIEREAGAIRGDAEAPSVTQSLRYGTIPQRIITPDGSIELNVRPRIVEISELKHASGDLQPRDRGTKEMETEALERAFKLDPEQLMPNRVADAGAPIVYRQPDGKFVIMSGNGRVLSLRSIYMREDLADMSLLYRERLGDVADHYRNPVLVMEITDELTPAELGRFADRANRSRIASMSVTERAQRDARAAGADIMTMYQGGEFSSRENLPFMRAFMRKVATAQEMADMSRDGRLTKPGIDRLNAAVLASAYDDTGILHLMLEDADNNIRSIANAYRDVAPQVMKMRAEIAEGLVREEVDITPNMMDAARFISQARDENIKIYNKLAQQDAFSTLDPVTEELIRQMYNPELTRAISSLRIAEFLNRYIEIAREKRTGGFLEDTTGPRDILEVTRGERVYEEEGFFTPEDEAAGPGTPGERGPAPEPVSQERGGAAAPERDEAGVAEAARPAPQEHPGRFTEKTLNARKKGELQNIAESLGLDTSGKKTDLIRRIKDDYQAAQAPEPRPERAALSDEEIDALPDVPEADQARADPEARTAFYDFLEGGERVGGTAHVARKLQIDETQAGLLIDEALENGWLIYNSQGRVIRAPKTQRPARPDSRQQFAISDEWRAGFDDFLNSGRRNTWINTPDANVYLRRSIRVDESGNPMQALDIASVEAHNTGRGHFTELLDDIFEQARQHDVDAIYIENVLTDRFAEYFRRTGWTEDKMFGPPSFWKKVSDRRSPALDGQNSILSITPEMRASIRKGQPLYAARPGGWDTPKLGEALSDPERMYRDMQVALTIQKAVGDALHRVPDIIRIRVMEKIMGPKGSKIAAMFDPDFMTIGLAREAIGRRSPVELVNHEIVHALKELGLFTEHEWFIIRQSFEYDGPKLANFYEPFFRKQAAEYFGLSREAIDFHTIDRLAEEKFATDHGRWAERRGKERDSILGQLHGRIEDFMTGLRDAFEGWIGRAKAIDPETGKPVLTDLEQISRAIEDGTIAQRWEEWGRSATDANDLARRGYALDEMVDDANRAMREVADNPHEAKARKKEEALKALAPCAKHHA